ncbi:glutathione S-transferase family protein [Alphaproteobacteria bacterium]|nr:glutathione S-transferase family protein [Alphaproteobacteria bacterium]MDC1121140.1 glutathione S-transferase family protein [Alphaproteobacteria bacterium]
MLILYDLPISSYGCKTRILLRHKNLSWHSVAPPDGYGSAAYCQIVPAGTIPALDDNGFIICDSEAIAEYINEIQPDPAMLPADSRARATARALSRFHDSRIEPLLRAYFGQVAPANHDADFIRENASLLQKRMQQLAQMVTPHPFLCGDILSLADCGFAPSFAILNRLQAILGFVVDLPDSLRAYEAALADHPSVTDELQGYFDALDGWTEDKLKS